MYQELIDFWFSDEVSQYWFNSTKAFDRQLLESYGETWQRAAQGELDDWQQTATGSLALIILFDQFPLNMFRGTPKCFSTEVQSVVIARHAIENEFDRQLAVNQRSFMYMPFMHSEDMKDQALALELFRQPGLENNYRFAKHHYSIVDQFGRFPHRNKIMGRESSEAEIKYLNSKQGFHG